MSTSQPSPETGADPGAPGAVVTAPPPEDIAPAADALAASSEVVANSLGEYYTAWWRKVRSGDSGVLPVIIGLVAIVIVFEVKTSLFLSAGNIVNLFNQAVVFIMFAIGEVFVLLLGEIDLSMVFVAGIGAGLMAALVAPALQPALVVGHPGRAQRHDGDRPHIRHAHHPPAAAGVHRHAGWLHRLAGRDDLDVRHLPHRRRWRHFHLQQGLARPGRWQYERRRQLDRDDRGRRGLRRLLDLP